MTNRTEDVYSPCQTAVGEAACGRERINRRERRKFEQKVTKKTKGRGLNGSAGRRGAGRRSKLSVPLCLFDGGRWPSDRTRSCQVRQGEKIGVRLDPDRGFPSYTRSVSLKTFIIEQRGKAGTLRLPRRHAPRRSADPFPPPFPPHAGTAAASGNQTKQK